MHTVLTKLALAALIACLCSSCTGYSSRNMNDMSAEQICAELGATCL